MHLLLFEPHLSHFGGHFNRYARIVATQASALGLPMTVAARNDILPELRASLERLGATVLPVFDSAPYRLGKWPKKREAVAREVADIALGCFRAIPGAKPAWLSGSVVHLQAACLFAAEARVPFAVQSIDFADDWPPGELTAPAGLREAAARGVEAGLRLYAQSTLLAKCLQEELGVPVGVFPALLDLLPLAARPPAQRPRVGFMNLLTGAKHRPATLAALAAHGNALSIVLHMGQGTAERLDKAIKSYLGILTGHGSDPLKPDISSPMALKLYFRRLLRSHGQMRHDVTIVPGALLPDDYIALWRTLDCTVLPYDPVRYARKGSGILLESLADGIIPIAPIGTSMAAMMAEAGVGVAYDSADPQGLPNAIAAMLRDFDSLSARSRDHAPRFRFANSPEKVVSLLIDPPGAP